MTDNQNFPNTPPPGFWIATALGIMASVVGVVFAGATPGGYGAFVQYLVLTLELAIISGICVGLLQSSRMSYLSSPAKARWVGITVLGTTIGWYIVFAFGALLGKLFPNHPIFSDQIIIAVFKGLLIGGSMGAIIGLATGIIQARFQHLGEQWIVGSLMSWSIGIAVLLAVFFAGISQIRLF